MSPLRRSAAGLLVLLCGSGAAHAAEYRKVTLQDGRTLVAEVLDTKPTGLELRLPQGETQVPFDTIASLEPVDASVFESQGPWTIVVLPPPRGIDDLAPGLSDQVKAGVDAIPDTVRTAPQQLTTLDPAGRARFSACGVEPLCIQRHLDQSEATAAISVTVEDASGGRQIVVTGAFSNAPRARREVTVDWNADPAMLSVPIAQAVQTALHLEPTTKAVVLPRPDDPVAQVEPEPTNPVEPKPEKPPKAEKPPKEGPSPQALRAMSWAPVPGLPSAARGDWGGFAASWGVVVPGSAAMVYLSGEAGFTPEQFLLTAVGGSYLLTVTANKAIGLRGLDATVSAAPLPGGAALSVSGTLGGTPERRGRR